MIVLSNVARLLTAAVLVALLVGGGDAAGPAAPLRLGSGTPAEELAALRAARPERALEWTDTVPPDPAVAALLAGAARAGVSVTLRHPTEPPRLRVEAPVSPVALRRAALTVTLRGAPGETVPVVVADGTALADTAAVTLGASGAARVTLAVLPTRAGPTTWRVSAAGRTARAHAWVRPEAPLSVLVLTGPPSWESRFAVRALESSGAVVDVRQALGRERVVASGGADVPRALDDLAARDVVLVLDGTADAGLLELLEAWVRERGGGVLLSPPPGGGTWAGWAAGGPPASLDAAALRWSSPAEVEPLPPAPLRVRAWPVTSPPGTSHPTWASAGEDTTRAVLAAAVRGRGRVVVSGLETWPWRMEAGLVAAHEAFWGSVVEWLAGGLTEGWTLSAPPAAPGVLWVGRLEGAVPDSLDLTPAEGSPEVVRPAVGNGAGDAVVRIVPLAPGGIALGEDRSHGVVVQAPGEPMTWADAALRVGGAGGLVEPAPAGAPDGSRPAPRPEPGRWPGFLLLAVLAASGWAARRLAAA